MEKLFFIVLAAVIFTACKKTKDDATIPSLPPTIAKIKTYTAGANINTYTYDAQGRVLQISRNNGSKDEYEYTPGLVTRKIYNSAGIYQYSYLEELNIDGFTKRTTRSDLPGSEELYVYNTDKTMAKQIIMSNGNSTVFDYFWSNGNLDSTRIINGNGVLSYTQVSTFYTDKLNVLSDAAFGEQLWGKNSKNLQKSSMNRFPGGNTTTPGNFDYEYDAQGRVTKKISTSGNNIYITLYTY